MTDKELLERAARAAGIDLSVYAFEPPIEPDEALVWNPLVDDGDALRLVVKLQLLVATCATGEIAAASMSYSVECIEPAGTNHYAATRRAIVRAAAELAKGVV
jgi:hypothetical protein